MQGLSTGLQSGFDDVLAFASGASSKLAEQLSTTVAPSLSLATSTLPLSGPDLTTAALQQIQLQMQQQPTPEVSVFIGNEQLDGHIDTRITTASRATRRTVLAGAGTSF
jgi:hypothetical protein